MKEKESAMNSYKPETVFFHTAPDPVTGFPRVVLEITDKPMMELARAAAHPPANGGRILDPEAACDSLFLVLDRNPEIYRPRFGWLLDITDYLAATGYDPAELDYNEFKNSVTIVFEVDDAENVVEEANEELSFIFAKDGNKGEKHD
jgi:hypothetical protein